MKYEDLSPDDALALLSACVSVPDFVEQHPALASSREFTNLVVRQRERNGAERSGAVVALKGPGGRAGRVLIHPQNWAVWLLSRGRWVYARPN